MGNTIKMVNVEMDMNVIRETAKSFGIKKVHGVKKELLVAQVNEAIEAKEKEMAAQNENQPEENPTPQNENQETTQETPEAPKPGKWYEAEGAFPYQENDIVIVTYNKHKGLIGRIAMVTKPSAKKDAVKAQLLHPKTGELQNTQVTLDFTGIELFLGADQHRKEEELATA